MLYRLYPYAAEASRRREACSNWHRGCRTADEDWSRLARLSQESRRLRGDARSRAGGGARADVRDPPTADVLVVNTCAFIDSAKQESIDAILEMAEHKKNGAGRRLIVTGCLAERYRDELRAEIPEIDAVLGTGEVPEIVGAIAGAPAPAGAPLTFFKRRRAARPRRPQAAADLHLRRRHAAPAGDAPALRLPQDRRRLRLQVRVLHHPDAARHYRSRPADSILQRSPDAGGARRQGAAPHLAGHDLLRDRPPRARRAGAAAARAERDRRPRMDSPALPLPDHDRRRDAGGHGRVREGLQVHRPAAAARRPTRCSSG